MASSSFSWDAVGTKEDLLDIITNISPDETPLFSRFSKTKSDGMTHSWLTDSLGAPAANKHKEDEVFSTASTAARVKLTNYVQIFMKGYFVTEAQEAVLKAGVDSEIRYQMGKAMKEIARDVEYAFINNSTSNVGDATTAPQMMGIPGFNTTNAVAMSSTPFSEDSLNDAIQLAWADGGSPKTVVLSGANKRIASGFTAGSMKTRDVGAKKLINVIDSYESDFGIVDLTSHRMVSDARIDILEDQYWKTAVFKPFTTYDLPKTSLKIEKVIVGYLTLECRAKDANASITGIVN